MSVRSNILLLFPSFERGGAEASLINYAKLLGDHYNVYILTSDNIFPIKLPSSVKILTYKHRRRRIFNTVNHCLRINRVLSQTNFFLVINFQAHFPVLLVLKTVRSILSLDVKLICRESNDIGIYIQSKSSLIYRFVIRNILKRLPYALADIIVCNSQQSRQSVLKIGVVSQKVRIWKNPIINHKNMLLWDKTLSSEFANREYDFCFVGRLTEQKNPLLFLALLEKLLELNPRYKAAICGDGNLMESVQAKHSLMPNNHQIEVLGYKKGMDVLRRSKCFLLTSAYEGSPNTLVEALISGCIVCANTGVAGVDEIIGGGKFGCEIDMRDVAFAAKRIDRYLRKTTPRDYVGLMDHFKLFDGNTIVKELEVMNSLRI